MIGNSLFSAERLNCLLTVNRKAYVLRIPPFIKSTVWQKAYNRVSFAFFNTLGNEKKDDFSTCDKIEAFGLLKVPTVNKLAIK